MGEYVPMQGHFPGEQYTPSNGTEGHSFIEHWCGRCSRDKAAREGDDIDACDDNEVCQILGASFRGEAVEWRELNNGDCVCLAFVEYPHQVPPPRCDRTADMFSGDTSP